MSQAESIRVIQTALGKLVAKGLLERIPSGEPGAIALEVGPMQTKCVWRHAAWWLEYSDDPAHELNSIAQTVVEAVRASNLEADLVVAARIDSPSERWEVLTIERPAKAPNTVEELLKLQSKS
jgi:hypothetical protein